MPTVLCDLGKDEEIRTEAANESDIEGLEENVNRLQNFRQVASENCMFLIPLASEFIEIARGKDNLNVVLNKSCEELSFPHLLKKGQFGYTTELETKLSPVEYFNQRFLIKTTSRCFHSV